jgi:hypothetical protein
MPSAGYTSIGVKPEVKARIVTLSNTLTGVLDRRIALSDVVDAALTVASRHKEELHALLRGDDTE